MELVHQRVENKNAYTFPEGWSVKKLGDLVKYKNGKSFEKNVIESGNYCLITLNSIDISGKLKADHLRVNIFDNSLEKNDLVMVLSDVAHGNFLGLTDLIPESNKFVLNQRMGALKDIKEVNPKYLSLYINKNQAYFKKSGKGSSQQNLGKKDILNFEVVIPSMLEQTAIANALSDADTLIGSLQRLIAKKRQIKQGAMQTLLNPYENGVLKAGWKLKKLGEIADVRSGGTPSTSVVEYWDGNILWCTPTDITALKGRKYIEDTARKISAKGLNDSSAEIIPVNSIVMTSRATIGECAINLFPITTNQGFKNFVPFESTNFDFLYYLLQTKKQIFIGLCSGSTFLEISKNQISNIEIHIPESKEIQTSIGNILSDMDKKISALESKLAKYQQIKQGMMQNLLTGRIRLV